VTEPVPLVLALLLVASSVSALLIKRLLWSLILLFYSSLLLGGILMWYGAVYAGFFQIITFAGAVSVMFMVIIMLVGQDNPERFRLGLRPIVGIGLSIVSFAPFTLLLGRVATVQKMVQESDLVTASMSDLGFLWSLQSWDLIFVLVPVGAAILAVINLFSKEGETE
jgi:NADH:ubiquinone oxidoreductase subunit 6 (subunit J)